MLLLKFDHVAECQGSCSSLYPLVFSPHFILSLHYRANPSMTMFNFLWGIWSVVGKICNPVAHLSSINDIAHIPQRLSLGWKEKLIWTEWFDLWTWRSCDIIFYWIKGKQYFIWFSLLNDLSDQAWSRTVLSLSFSTLYTTTQELSFCLQSTQWKYGNTFYSLSIYKPIFSICIKLIYSPLHQISSAVGKYPILLV